MRYPPGKKNPHGKRSTRFGNMGTFFNLPRCRNATPRPQIRNIRLVRPRLSVGRNFQSVARVTDQEVGPTRKKEPPAGSALRQACDGGSALADWLRALAARTTSRLAGEESDLAVVAEQAGRIPNAVRPALHIIPETRLTGTHRVPMSGRLTPAIDAIDRGVDHRLVRPAFGDDFLGAQPKRKQRAETREPTPPIMVARTANSG